MPKYSASSGHKWEEGRGSRGKTGLCWPSQSPGSSVTAARASLLRHLLRQEPLSLLRHLLQLVSVVSSHLFLAWLWGKNCTLGGLVLGVSQAALSKTHLREAERATPWACALGEALCSASALFAPSAGLCCRAVLTPRREAGSLLHSAALLGVPLLTHTFGCHEGLRNGGEGRLQKISSKAEVTVGRRERRATWLKPGAAASRRVPRGLLR